MLLSFVAQSRVEWKTDCSRVIGFGIGVITYLVASLLIIRLSVDRYIVDIDVNIFFP
jgi:hypothetical protein